MAGIFPYVSSIDYVSSIVIVVILVLAAAEIDGIYHLRLVGADARPAVHHLVRRLVEAARLTVVAVERLAVATVVTVERLAIATVVAVERLTVATVVAFERLAVAAVVAIERFTVAAVVPHFFATWLYTGSLAYSS